MNIYVRNLSPGTSRAELLGCFRKYGAVEDVTISTYKVEGQAKASAFIEMPSQEQALAAVTALQGCALGGTLLKLQEVSLTREDKKR